MKRFFYVLFLLSIAPCITFAQSFKFQDDQTYAVHQWEAESNNDIKAYVINLTNMPLSMSWKLVSATIDTFTICDNETCLEGSHPGRTSMTALPPNEPIEFLKVSVATYLPKSGKATYLVYATNEGEASGKEFTFEITSTPVSVQEEVETRNSFIVMPNPVADFFLLRRIKEQMWLYMILTVHWFILLQYNQTIKLSTHQILQPEYIQSNYLMALQYNSQVS